MPARTRDRACALAVALLVWLIAMAAILPRIGGSNPARHRRAFALVREGDSFRVIEPDSEEMDDKALTAVVAAWGGTPAYDRPVPLLLPLWRRAYTVVMYHADGLSPAEVAAVERTAREVWADDPEAAAFPAPGVTVRTFPAGALAGAILLHASLLGLPYAMVRAVQDGEGRERAASA